MLSLSVLFAINHTIFLSLVGGSTFFRPPFFYFRTLLLLLLLSLTTTLLLSVDFLPKGTKMFQFPSLMSTLPYAFPFWFLSLLLRGYWWVLRM